MFSLSAMKHFTLPKPSKLHLNMEKKNWKDGLRRLGVAGFLFFLIKGLIWLAVFLGLFKSFQ